MHHIAPTLYSPTPTCGLCLPQKAKLPDLPSHAAYVRHQNECYDWGSYGWLLLQTGFVNIAKYRYFFFVNSSVRGPFLPAYARVSGPVGPATTAGGVVEHAVMAAATAAATHYRVSSLTWGFHPCFVTHTNSCHV